MYENFLSYSYFKISMYAIVPPASSLETMFFYLDLDTLM